MCDNCKEIITETSETSKPNTEQESKSPLDDILLFTEPFSISTDNLENHKDIKIDKDEFIKGMKEASYFSGFYTCLINSGMSMEDVVSIIMNKMNVDHNILMSRIQTDGSIEVSKNSVLIKEKDML